MPKLLALSVLYEIFIGLQLGAFKDLIVQLVFVKRMFLGGKEARRLEYVCRIEDL
ncbi:hypothetical protein M422DRAFT_25097, partial [Sphaerobolus stellatus SS14]